MRLLVIDNSQGTEFARTLGRSGLFDEVGYFAPWQEDNPVLREVAVGSGFDEIIREYALYDALEDYDAFAFPHLYWSDMQAWLRGQDYPVWGAGSNEMLERDRWFLLNEMTRVGLKTPKSRLYTLAAIPNVAVNGDIVKVSTLRGDAETVVISDDWSWYHELCLQWGPYVDQIFVVLQKPLPKGAECGFDLLVSRGKILRPFSIGYESKDAGYIEKNVSEMPEPMKAVFDAIPKLIGPDYSNFLSTEVLSRTLLDITTRIPQPPGDLKLYIWRGLPSVVLETLQGRDTDGTTPRAPWGVQLIAHNNEPKRYKKIGKIPSELQPYVFFNRPFMFDGEVWLVPWRNPNHAWVDAVSVVGCGATPEEAIDEAKRVVDELDMPSEVAFESGATDKLLETLASGESEGIIFDDVD